MINISVETKNAGLSLTLDPAFNLFNYSLNQLNQPLTTYLSTSLLITIFCISLVPSPMVQSLASR
jgi:hypothetical protein